ncbi:MAG: hypothetical protein R3C97_13565 [Geminicoccaceae bacterium]
MPGFFDAVANVTPDAVHHATTLPVLAAGKHILCEKPLHRPPRPMLVKWRMRPDARAWSP